MSDRPLLTVESPDGNAADKVRIHPTAVIHPSAQIHESVQIGPYAVIGAETKIGAETQIGAHAVIEHAEVGASCRIFSHALIGTAPQDLKYRGEKTKIVIGDGTIVRECATLNRGTAASGETRIGKSCLFMAYSHVAHDCVIEDEVILANSVAVAGHVSIGMGTVVGGLSGIHQFVRVGKMVMIGAGAMVPMDVPPFCTVWGDRARIVGLNIEGLKRRHVSKESIEALKRAYKKTFFGKGTLKQIANQIEKENSSDDHVRDFLKFISASQRGLCRPKLKAETSASQTW